MKARIIALVSLVFLFACNPQEQSRITKTYADGTVEHLEKFKVQNGDTVITYKQWFHSNGTLYMEGPIDQGKREGVWKTFYEDGKPWSETSFSSGKSNGPTKTWYKNGEVRFTGQFTMGKKTGLWHWYDKEGKLMRKIDLDKGEISN